MTDNQLLADAWARVDALPAYDPTSPCPTCGYKIATAKRITPMQVAAHDQAQPHASAHRWLAYPVLCRQCTECGTCRDEKPLDHDQHRPHGATPAKPRRARTNPSPATA